MGRLCVLAIILLASPTLPREVLVLESSTFPVTLPTVGALDVATCADLNATAADLCTREGIAAAQHDACIGAPVRQRVSRGLTLGGRRPRATRCLAIAR